MTLQELLTEPGVTAAAIARDVGCHRSYITRCADPTSGRTLSIKAALKIWHARKVKVEPLGELSDREVGVLSKIGAQAA
ncbi:hypothetical protein [Devosia sp.]|uniref:hypothetical protein n=1 Tax=Devosia sp. TaxID=1871048 RepID=UPI002FCB4FBA